MGTGVSPSWRSHFEKSMERPLRRQGVPVFAGEPQHYDPRTVSEAMRAEEVVFDVDLGVGPASGEAWGCDLSAQYVSINADYTT